MGKEVAPRPGGLEGGLGEDQGGKPTGEGRVEQVCLFLGNGESAGCWRLVSTQSVRLWPQWPVDCVAYCHSCE